MHGIVGVGVGVEDHNVVRGSGCEQDETAVERKTGGDVNEGGGEEDGGNCGRHRQPLCHCLRSYCCWQA